MQINLTSTHLAFSANPTPISVSHQFKNFYSNNTPSSSSQTLPDRIIHTGLGVEENPFEQNHTD